MNIHSNIRKPAMIVMIALAMSPAVLWAGNHAKATEERGVIASVDATARQLTVSNPKTKAAGTFTWNEQTKFSEHGKSANASALKEGMAVDLTYTTVAGTRTLRQVKLVPAKPTKHGSSSNVSSAKTP